MADPVSILSTDPDKIEKYRFLLNKVKPFIQSSEKLEKRAAVDLNILLKCAINQSDNTVLFFLNPAIEHLVNYFMASIYDIIGQKIDWTYSHICCYDMLNDLVQVIMQTVLHKQNMMEFSQLCLLL